MQKIYGYARVSTVDQNADRQIDALLNSGVEERDIIVDKASGKDFERNGYMYLKERLLREGDVLIVKSLDRLSRNKADIKNELEYYRNKGIRLKIIDFPTTMIDLPSNQDWVLEMVNNILIEVLSSIAEQERLTIRQRQREGIESARKKGKHLGRPAAIKPDNWDDVYGRWKSGDITGRQAMEELGMKRTTFYKMVKEGNV